MKGRSMLPDLREGMTLHLSPAPARLRVGEIVVFRAGERLVAHRIVRVFDDAVVCAGDAQPDCLERVERDAVIAKVENVYDAFGNRIHGVAFRLRGLVRAHTRRLRAFACLVLPSARARTYAALIAVMTAAVRNDAVALNEALEGTVPWRLAAMARRHRCAAALCAALENVPAGEAGAVLKTLLKRERWAASARATRMATQAATVAGVLREAGLEPVLLKGAARAVCGRPEAQTFESVDIDVLVAPGRVQDACEALKAAGYVQPLDGANEEFYRGHHHAPPLFSHAGVSVEVHRALSRLPLAAPASWIDLEPFVTREETAWGTVRVLDPTGTALHLIVHALQRPALRELVLLALQLRRLSESELRRLRGVLAREMQHDIALNGVAAFGAQIAGIEWQADPRARRFARWMQIREDLPRPLRARTACMDAYLSSHESGSGDAVRAAFAESTGPLAVRSARAMTRLLSAVATAAYVSLMLRADRVRQTR